MAQSCKVSNIAADVMLQQQACKAADEHKQPLISATARVLE
jgi:hypothetical protein